jgi:hypothetical protein
MNHTVADELHDELLGALTALGGSAGGSVPSRLNWSYCMAWHGDVLRQRAQRLTNGDAAPIPWSEAKDHLQRLAE